MIDVLTLIGFVVVALVFTGISIAMLLVAAILFERFTGIPADQRRLMVETPVEHRARLAAQALSELIDAEDERRSCRPELVRGEVISLEGWRASHDRGSAA